MTRPMRRARVEIKPRIMLGDVRAMGPGKADLLELIVKTGSISAAAKRMSMSYRRAWLLVDAMNAAFKEPLVLSTTGGRGGGGAVVTDFGLEVLTLYRQMQRALEREAAKPLAAFQRRLRGA